MELYLFSPYTPLHGVDRDFTFTSVQLFSPRFIFLLYYSGFMTQYNVIHYQGFGGICCLHLQGTSKDGNGMFLLDDNRQPKYTVS